MSTVTGTPGDDLLDGTPSDDDFMGLAGRDTARIAAPSSNATFQLDALNRWVVTSSQGVDTLTSIEAVQFTDGTITPGTELQIRAQPTSNTVGLTAMPDGSYLAAWIAGANTVEVQRVDVNGRLVGQPITVTQDASSSDPPSIAAFANGGFVVTWSRLSAATLWDVYAQRFDAAGNRVGGETLVNSESTVGEDRPRQHAVTALNDGGFAVTWSTTLAPPGPRAVYVKHFDAAGNAVAINLVDGPQYVHDSTITGLANGGYVVTWLSDNSVYQRQYLANDQPATGPVLVAQAGYDATTTALRDGGWVTAYGGPGHIYTQRYDANGGRVGDAVQADSVAAINNYTPSVTGLADGGYLVAWQAYTDTSTYDTEVYAQRFDASGARVGGQVLVNSFTQGYQYSPIAQALPDGGWVIVFGSNGGDMTPTGMVAKHYDSSGTPVSSGTSLFGDDAGNTLDFVGTQAMQLWGMGGDDRLHGGSANDLIAGGTGSDTVLLDDSLANVSWTFAAQRVLQVTSSSGGTDTLRSIEHAQAPAATVDFVTGGLADRQIGAAANFNEAAQITPMPDGSFLVSWEAGFRPSTPRGTFSSNAYVQHFDALGSALTGAIALPGTLGSGTSSAPRDGGGWVSAWQGTLGNLAGLYMQNFDAAGTPTGSPVLVAAGMATLPQVLALPGGQHVIAWMAPDGDGNGIFAQRFDAGGAPLAPVAQVGSASLDARDPAISSVRGGGYVITWAVSDTVNSAVHVQRFDANGAPTSGDTLVASTGWAPDVLGFADGSYLVAWDAGAMVMTQRFDATGALQGAPVQIDARAAGADAPALAALPDGGWLVSWSEANAVIPNAREVYLQRLDAAGHRAGAEVQVNSLVAGQHFRPDIAALADGSWMAATGRIEQGFGPGLSTYLDLQRFDAQGVPDAYLALRGGTEDDVLRMASSAERVRLDGGAGNDTLMGAPGAATDDVLNGGAGIDTALYAGARANYTILKVPAGFHVNGAGAVDGVDTLIDVERVHFADIDVALDVQGNAGMAYRLYQAAFDRAPDLPGLGFHIRDLDKGVPLTTVAAHFIESPEFQATYGAAVTDEQFITLLYHNVLGREPDPGGLAFHLHDMASGVPRNYELIHFSESPENQALVIGQIENGMEYVPLA